MTSARTCSASTGGRRCCSRGSSRARGPRKRIRSSSIALRPASPRSMGGASGPRARRPSLSPVVPRRASPRFAVLPCPRLPRAVPRRPSPCFAVPRLPAAFRSPRALPCPPALTTPTVPSDPPITLPLTRALSASLHPVVRDRRAHPRPHRQAVPRAVVQPSRPVAQEGRLDRGGGRRAGRGAVQVGQLVDQNRQAVSGVGVGLTLS